MKMSCLYSLASGEHCTLHVYTDSQEEGTLIHGTKSMSIDMTQTADHMNAS